MIKVLSFKLKEPKKASNTSELVDAIKDQYDRSHPSTSSSGKGSSGSKQGK